MLFAEKDHAANAPETWLVVRTASRTNRWALTSAAGLDYIITHYRTKRDAEEARQWGPWVTLYEKERRWYAGEQIPGWRPYAQVKRGG